MSKFMFQSPAGFHDPELHPLLSLHALQYLDNLKTGNPQLAAIINPLMDLCQELPRVTAYTPTLPNDCPASEQTGMWNDDSRFYPSNKPCVGFVMGSPPRTRFSPSILSPDVVFNKDLLGRAHELLQNKSLVSAWTKLAKEHNITFHTKALKSAAKLFDDLNKGTWSIRVEDVEADLSQSEVWAIFCNQSEKFIDPQWSPASIGTSRLFPSKELAEKALASRGRGESYTIVRLSMRLSAIEEQASRHSIPDSLQGALAAAQKKELQQALEAADIQQLRDRLAELEDAPDRPARTRRM